MGGGRSTASAMYGIYRKTQIVEKMIDRTMKSYGYPIPIRYVKVKVINEDKWISVGGYEDAAGFYRAGNLYIRRKYFAGKKTTNVIIHEMLHGQSGPHRHEGLGATFEEGTVEYLTQGVLYFGVRGRSAEYAKGYRAYEPEVKVVSKLMQIIGRDNFLKHWRKGFGVTPGTDPTTAGHWKLAKKLSDRGFTRTASIIRHEYYGIEEDRQLMTEKLNRAITQDIKQNNLPKTIGIRPDFSVRDFKEWGKTYGRDYAAHS